MILTATYRADFEAGPPTPDDRDQAIDLSRREAIGGVIERGLALNENAKHQVTRTFCA